MLSKKEEAKFSAWAGKNMDTLMVMMKLQRKGFDLKSYLRDHINGKPKDPKHYWGKKEGRS